MPCCKQEIRDFTHIQPILERYKQIPGSLISVLQQVQDCCGYLSADVLRHIAAALGLPSAEVFGVATFYTQFRFSPAGKYLILLCQGTACHVNGSQALERTIQEELGIADGETTKDSLFSLQNVACLGCCSLSPVMTVNGETYGKLTPQKLRDTLRQLREQAEAERQAEKTQSEEIPTEENQAEEAPGEGDEA